MHCLAILCLCLCVKVETRLHTFSPSAISRKTPG
ncbi:unnamed protein product [Amoebophrya sp. A120]|nr:unnamed protein product [Amoebophrya sp. A120]|eukprot:GSA120T00015342001.1